MKKIWSVVVCGVSLCLSAMPALSAPVASSPAPAIIEVGFSPEGSAQRIVLDTIASAQKTLLLAAYSFTDPDVVRDLVVAKRRGVDVYVLVDEKANVSRGVTPTKSMHALNTLVSAGIAVRTIGAYPIHHDKYIVVDGKTVQTGSYNYSAAARNRNSENVLLIRNSPELATRYYEHFLNRWERGDAYRPYY